MAPITLSFQRFDTVGRLLYKYYKPGLEGEPLITIFQSVEWNGPAIFDPTEAVGQCIRGAASATAGHTFSFHSLSTHTDTKMQSARMQLWAAEPEIDEDLAEVDIGLALGSYGQNGLYDESASSIHPGACMYAYRQRW